MKKILSFMISAMMIVMMFVTPVFAVEPSTSAAGGEGGSNPPPSTPGGFGAITVTPQAPTGAQASVAAIIGYMQWFGYAIAIGMLVYIGIKYVMAPANEKADLKNNLVRYVIGSVLIAGAVTIASWVFAIGV